MSTESRSRASLGKTTGNPPLVWLLLGHKQGDNGQVLTLAEALDWPCIHKTLQVREPFIYGKARVGSTLYHVDLANSDPLEPPWPDLVLTIGRSLENVALWIRQQSGGHTRIALVGKPSGKMKDCALLIASEEILLPPYANVLPITMPLMKIDVDAIDQAAEKWRTRFANLPKPLIGIMVGGPTNPFIYNHRVTEQLLEAAEQIIHNGGTPYITTSRRTPQAIVQALQQRLPAQARMFAWPAQAEDNPYLGLLGQGDGFIVTGDSISMMLEVARLGKPLQILPLPCGIIGSIDQLRRTLARWLYKPDEGRPHGLRKQLAYLAYHTHVIRHTRDYRGFHRILVELGIARWPGEGFQAPQGVVPDDVALVTRQIKALFT